MWISEFLKKRKLKKIEQRRDFIKFIVSENVQVYGLTNADFFIDLWLITLRGFSKKEIFKAHRDLKKKNLGNGSNLKSFQTFLYNTRYPSTNDIKDGWLWW